MYKQEELNEIIEALRVIKDVCEDQNGNCKQCPLRSADDECGICDEEPRDWEIYDPNDPPEIKLITN